MILPVIITLSLLTATDASYRRDPEIFCAGAWAAVLSVKPEAARGQKLVILLQGIGLTVRRECPRPADWKPTLSSPSS